MEQRTLGRSGIRASRIGLGCATFGREIPEETAFRIMDYAVQRGITLFDTAEAYGGGQARQYRKNQLGIDDEREVSGEMHSSESRTMVALALSVCFIYQHETIKQRVVSRVCQTFLRDFVFSISRPDCRPTESVRDGTMTLAYRPSHVSQKNQKVSPGRKECQAPSISLRSLRLGEIRFFPSE